MQTQTAGTLGTAYPTALTNAHCWLFGATWYQLWHVTKRTRHGQWLTKRYVATTGTMPAKANGLAHTMPAAMAKPANRPTTMLPACMPSTLWAR